jgi:hypothetical protein
VALCSSHDITRRQDAEALLEDVDATDKMVLASCLLTHPLKECRNLALELLPPSECWDPLLCENVPLLLIEELLRKIQADCKDIPEYIKAAFLLLRPRLASVTEQRDIARCFNILNIFYEIPLFLEDSFFKALHALHGAVTARAFGHPVTQALAKRFTESFKSFFSRQSVEDAKLTHLGSIPLPIQRKLAHDGHFIEYFICSSRDPIALETIPHVISSENAVSFFRINTINPNALDCLAVEKRLHSQYPIKLAFCKNPKAKAQLLMKFIPTLNRGDLKAIAQDKMVSGFAREYANKLYVAKR